MYSVQLRGVQELILFSVDPLSEIMDPELTPVVDLPRLRKLCMHGGSHHYLSPYDRSRVSRQGIPDEPVWLRPRLWKLVACYAFHRSP